MKFLVVPNMFNILLKLANKQLKNWSLKKRKILDNVNYQTSLVFILEIIFQKSIA